MTTSTCCELLTVALQDLREGRRQVVERLPDVRSAISDPATDTAFGRLIERSRDETETLAHMLDDPEGDPNLWADGILNDACRDIESTARGAIRDIALIGAIRKFLAADFVSLETAIALAKSQRSEHTNALENLRQAASAADQELREQLLHLTDT